MPTVVITGTSRGIGLELTKHYLAAGWTVVAACRDPDRAEALKVLTPRAEAKLELRALDVASDAANAAFAASLGARPIDLLIANAGMYGGQAQTPHDLTRESFAEIMMVNALAPVKLAAALADNLAAASAAKAAFITSTLGSVARNNGGMYAYRASKAALNQLVSTLSLELSRRGVACLLLHPGWVKTDMGGSNADIDVATSVAGLTRVIAGAGPSARARYLDYAGAEIPW